MSTPRISNLLCLAASMLLTAACAESTGPSICPECTPVEPGKGSTAASGSVAACTLAYLERTIDRAEAEKLGFPVTDAAELIERPIDTAARWVPQSTDGGGPASGYARETRIRVILRVDSYLHRALDPTRCDGTVCKIDGEDTEQSYCPDAYLMMQVSGELETLDGAIAAELPTQPVNVRRPGQRDDIVVAASADLSKVRGSLKIDPGVQTPRVGRLDLSLQFPDAQHRGYGVASISVNPDWDNLSDVIRASIPSRFADYRPIQAEWGDPPTGSPTVSDP